MIDKYEIASIMKINIIDKDYGLSIDLFNNSLVNNKYDKGIEIMKILN